ncbi:ECF-type sigma factor [Zavarzinella formosa]|uniref:ECF-type sigma factor n=1 Tax=Zavarzinella formosa TaxID=360055 RepID=UPI0003709198|nr:ECF-type sigma factor [Zavarzinella formosa]
MPEFTQLLVNAGSGDETAIEHLFAQVYGDLRLLATQRLAQEAPGNTLQPTALVHEVYLRLIKSTNQILRPEDLPGDSRSRFFAAAANAMRRILIESARRKKRDKHGGTHQRIALDPDQVAEPEMAEELLALDEALTILASIEPQIAELVTLRYFGGLTLKESAVILGIAPRTADAHWAYARAWLLAEIQQSAENSEF